MEEDERLEAKYDSWDLEFQASYHFQMTLEKLKEAKLNDRGDLDRRFAITITELEKVIAYYDYYISRAE